MVSCFVAPADLQCDVCCRSAVQASTETLDSTTPLPSPVKCFRCDKQFPNEDKLIAHARTHSNKSLQCPYCKNAYVNQKRLTSHIQYFHAKHRSTGPSDAVAHGDDD
jgi:hypothetical protein